MKFSPESLLQIYLDGSFTEEAQAEFDKLIQKDPLFSERVTQAVAERVGPVPEAQLSALESRLDARMANVWKDHKPSPVREALKLVGGFAAMGLGLTALYFGGTHLLTFYHGMAASSAMRSQTAQSPDLSGSPSTDPSSNEKPALASKPALVKARSSQMPGAVPKSSISSSRSTDGMASGLTTQRSAQKDIPSTSDKATGTTASSVNGVSAVTSSNQPALSNTFPAAPSLATQPSLPPPSLGGQSQEGNALRVSVETQKTQNVVVNVLDSNGLLVRRLYQGSWEAGVHQVDWDGKDETRNPVLPGDYTVIVNADGKAMSGVVTVKPHP